MGIVGRVLDAVGPATNTCTPITKSDPAICGGLESMAGASAGIRRHSYKTALRCAMCAEERAMTSSKTHDLTGFQSGKLEAIRCGGKALIIGR